MSYKRHRKYKAGANWAGLFLDLFLIFFVRPIEWLITKINARRRPRDNPPDQENPS